jgi:hypothetical protein
VLRRNTFNFATGTYWSDIDFNPKTGNFVAVWSQGFTHGAEINGNGDVVAKGLVSSTTGTYDGLAISYSPKSETLLMVGQAPGHIGSYNIYAAELNGRGARTSTDTEISSLFKASFHPRVAAKTGPLDGSPAEWNVTFSSQGIYNQVVRSSTTGGGPAGSLGSVPPPATGGGSGCSTADPFANLGGGTCVNGGWVAPGSGGSSGSGSGGSVGGSGCPGTAPFSGAVCQNGGWVPGGSGSGGSSGGSSSGGCATPDPFVAMGGGTCINGGWIFGLTPVLVDAPELVASLPASMSPRGQSANTPSARWAFGATAAART